MPHSQEITRCLHRSCIAVLFFVLASLGVAWASITGSISGVVTDPSGAVVAGANVVAVDASTGVKNTVSTDSKGFFNLPVLSVGTYDLEISQSGFKTSRITGLVIDTNSALRSDVTLQIGQAVETVVITGEGAHVETESTQMGDVISGRSMTAVPLNGRSYTDLLSLQPGVVPGAYATQAAGINDRPVDGGLNAGNQSVNGQRETSNGFMVNGSNVEEGKNNGAAVIPNLDSIAEFRIITNNFDAEYGNYSGGQVNVVTKSGENQLHGSAFEFLRNTVLDAKNYFAQASDPTPVFQQNQFGGTIGGPIRKDKTFFFVDYQGTRQNRGLTQNEQLPSLADRTGDLSDQTDGLTGSVNSDDASNPASWAAVLSNRLGYPVAAGEPYYTPGCTSNDAATGCVFPNAFIPQSAWSPAAAGMLKYIPNPNAPDNFFETSAAAQKLNDDKGGLRIDQNTHLGNFFAYYFYDDYVLDSPYPNAGATLPGFGANTGGRTQLFNLGNTKNFGDLAVNEVRFSFVRNTLALTNPNQGIGVSLASLGFVTPWGPDGGISAIKPSLEGVPFVQFNQFSFGVPTVTTRQFNNSFQILDNFTRIIGRHTVKIGGQFHYDQINERNLAAEDGQFGFSGSETGVDFADFLIGAPDNLTQASPQILDSRSKYYGLYAQDSWRVTSNLVFNYGLRWEASMPWYDTQNKIETIIPGEQSKVFPGAPTGWVVPGDPGVPRTLAPTRYGNFSPRLGLAYSPSFDSGFLGKLLGGPGKTSIRLGAGLYYTSVEDLSQFLEVGDPPYGFYYGSSNPPRLEAPYIDRSTGNTTQRFPFVFPPTNVSASNPDTTFDWAQVEPISYGFSFDHRNKLPYSEHYELSIQRQFGANSVASISYVGNQGHRLVTSIEANPANPALCLYLNDPANLDPASAPPCGPFGETPSGGPWITLPGSSPFAGQTFASTRPLGPNFDTNPFVSTVANSRYNSLQLSLQHTSGPLTLLAGYTYSKCLDNASGLQDSTYPFNPRLSYSLCSFDVTHNFVFSYNWNLPFGRLVSSGWAKKVAGGWALSGITTFASGLPIGLSENDDNALIGANAVPVDVPDFAGGHVLADTNPRDRQPYFDDTLFSNEQLGQFGTSRRRFFHGPGLNNFDMALLKTTKLTESKELQLRFEAFNLFNHAQFYNPNSEINDGSPSTGGTFGLVTSARDPRIMQIGAKFLF